MDIGLVVKLEDGVVRSPNGNSLAYQNLTMLARIAQESLERYFMVLTLLAKEGSGKLTAKQVTELAYLIGGRVAVLYGEDMPDLFDKALFSNFLNALIRTQYLQVEDELLYFDERIDTVAGFAQLVLGADTLTLVNEAGKLSLDEINTITQSSNKRFFG